MWRTRVFQWTDSATGIRDEGVYNSKTGKYDKHRTRSFLTASWHDDRSRYSLGAQYREMSLTSCRALLNKQFRCRRDMP